MPSCRGAGHSIGPSLVLRDRDAGQDRRRITHTNRRAQDLGKSRLRTGQCNLRRLIEANVISQTHTGVSYHTATGARGVSDSTPAMLHQADARDVSGHFKTIVVNRLTSSHVD